VSIPCIEKRRHDGRRVSHSGYSNIDPADKWLLSAKSVLSDRGTGLDANRYDRTGFHFRRIYA
jgi:hypothetical protein